MAEIGADFVYILSEGETAGVRVGKREMLDLGKTFRDMVGSILARMTPAQADPVMLCAAGDIEESVLTRMEREERDGLKALRAALYA